MSCKISKKLSAVRGLPKSMVAKMKDKKKKGINQMIAEAKK